MFPRIDELMRRLASDSIISVEPLRRFTPYEFLLFRGMLSGLGDPSQFDQSVWVSLLEKQFRPSQPNHGRYPGMLAVLGADRLDDLFVLAKEHGTRRIKSSTIGEPIEGTEGRGILQAAANIVGLYVLGVEYGDEFRLRLNRGIWREWIIQYNDNPEILNTHLLPLFQEMGEPPTKLTASLSPDGLLVVWDFLTGR